MLAKARDVKTQLALFDTMRRRIRNDPNLSQSGKDRALQNLEDSIKAYRKTAHAALQEEWREARQSFMDLQERGKAAEARVEASYDYTKLAYHRQTAETLIARERDLPAVEALIMQNADSGDRERRRAWLEAWPAVEKRGGGGGGALAGWMRSELERELTPATMPKILADRDTLLPQIVELHGITDSVSGWYGGARSVFSVPDEFETLLAGVSIRSFVEGGEYKTSVNFADEAAAAAPASAVASI